MNDKLHKQNLLINMTRYYITKYLVKRVIVVDTPPSCQL